jgi:DNA-binding MarR family transcriptional regulator
MDRQMIDRISEDLYSILPIIHKKLVGILSKGTNIDLSHYHLAILGMLSKSESLAISEIGRRLSVSKPQMTIIIDKLIDLQLIYRSASLVDRRIINISITDKGRDAMKQSQEKLKSNIKIKLASLNDQDLELLSKSIDGLRSVVLKIE